MQTYDLIMIGVLAGTALYGYWKGLAWQVASIASIILSYFVALNSHSYTPKFGLQPPLDTAASMLMLYLGSSAGVWVGFGFISKSLKAMKLKDWDHQAGALVGAVKGGLFCMLITIFAMTLGPKEWGEAIPKSASGRYIAVALTKTKALLPANLNQMISKYVDPVKSQLESGQGGGGFLAGGESGGSDSGNLLTKLEKAGSDLLSKAKQQVGAQIESQTKKGAEDLLNDLGKKVSEKLPSLSPSGGASTSTSGGSQGNSIAGQSTPLAGSQNLPEATISESAPLGIQRPQNAGRPSIRMPDFSSKRWQRK